MKYLKFVGCTILIFVLLLASYCFLIVYNRTPIFHSSYQSVMQDKYDSLMSTNEKKIVVISGSSSSFGLNQYLLEEKTGYKVVNLGLHAGFCNLFYSEMAKKNINKGDIILLGYEYGWEKPNAFDTLGTDLIMTGIDNRYEMYKVIPLKKWVKLFAFLPDYAKKKATFSPASGVYSRDAFDKNGQMINIPEESMGTYDTSIYGNPIVVENSISEDSIKYLKEFKKFAEEKGAKIYFIAPPILDQAMKSNQKTLQKLKNEEIEKIGIPYISDPCDYLFPIDLISNSSYHCTKKGADYRTELLIKDLKNASVVQ